MSRIGSNACRRSRPEANPLFRRLLLIALLLEAGLALVLIPWSMFWDRNYLAHLVPGLTGFITNNYTRGAVTGLGLLNVWTAIEALADLFNTRSGTDEE